MRFSTRRSPLALACLLLSSAPAAAQQPVLNSFAVSADGDTRYELVVSQAAGGDHMHRDHRMYIARGDSLAKVWSQASGQMGAPTWISLWVADIDGNGIDELVFLYRDHSWQPEGSEDYWQLFTLGWDVSARALKKVSEPERRRGAYAAIVGSYETLIEARQAHDALGGTHDCLAAFHVYRSDYYPRLSPGWFIVAYLSMEREKVEEKLANAEACSAAIEGYVKRAY